MLVERVQRIASARCTQICIQKRSSQGLNPLRYKHNSILQQQDVQQLELCSRTLARRQCKRSTSDDDGSEKAQPKPQPDPEDDDDEKDDSDKKTIAQFGPNPTFLPASFFQFELIGDKESWRRSLGVWCWSLGYTGCLALVFSKILGLDPISQFNFNTHDALIGAMGAIPLLLLDVAVMAPDWSGGGQPAKGNFKVLDITDKVKQRAKERGLKGSTEELRDIGEEIEKEVLKERLAEELEAMNEQIDPTSDGPAVSGKFPSKEGSFMFDIVLKGQSVDQGDQQKKDKQEKDKQEGDHKALNGASMKVEEGASTDEIATTPTVVASSIKSDVQGESTSASPPTTDDSTVVTASASTSEAAATSSSPATTSADELAGQLSTLDAVLGIDPEEEKRKEEEAERAREERLRKLEEEKQKKIKERGQRIQVMANVQDGEVEIDLNNQTRDKLREALKGEEELIQKIQKKFSRQEETRVQSFRAALSEFQEENVMSSMMQGLSIAQEVFFVLTQYFPDEMLLRGVILTATAAWLTDRLGEAGFEEIYAVPPPIDQLFTQDINTQTVALLIVTFGMAMFAVGQSMAGVVQQTQGQDLVKKAVKQLVTSVFEDKDGEGGKKKHKGLDKLLQKMMRQQSRVAVYSALIRATRSGLLTTCAGVTFAATGNLVAPVCLSVVVDGAFSAWQRLGVMRRYGREKESIEELGQILMAKNKQQQGAKVVDKVEDGGGASTPAKSRDGWWWYDEDEDEDYYDEEEEEGEKNGEVKRGSVDLSMDDMDKFKQDADKYKSRGRYKRKEETGGKGGGEA